MGFIREEQLRKLAETMKDNRYGSDLLRLLG
jgi:hypothetical protein